MNEKTLKIAISSQKGGVGKSTCTILVAGVLHYLKNFNCAIVDGDAPQHSIHVLRQRDMEAVGQSDFLKVALYRQFERIHKKSYPIIRSTPVSAVEELEKYQREHPEQHFDIVLFDLPGTLRSEGVIYTISQMDYVFVPLKADNIVMQSSLPVRRSARRGAGAETKLQSQRDTPFLEYARSAGAHGYLPAVERRDPRG